MRIVILWALIITLGLGNYVGANVSSAAKRNKIINYSMGATHTGIALALLPCANAPATSAACLPAHLGAAAQATMSFLQAALGEDSCAASSNGGTSCYDTPPPGPPPGWNPPGPGPGPYTSGGATAGSTGGTTGAFPTAFPRPAVLPPGRPGIPTPPSLNARLPAVLAQRPDLKKVLDNLKNKGYTMDFDKGVVNTPNGPVGMDSLNDSAQASLGGNAAAMKLVEEVSKKAAEDMKKDIAAKFAAEGLDGGGGGGGMQAALPGEDDAMKEYMKRMMARMPAQEKNNINGLSVMFNGEPIGIAQGNIFKTIEMRYDKLEQTGMFLGPPAP